MKLCVFNLLCSVLYVIFCGNWYVCSMIDDVFFGSISGILCVVSFVCVWLVSVL